MGYEIDLLQVGDGSKSGDAIALRFGNLFGSRDEQFVMVIDCGYSATGDTIVNFVKEKYQTEWINLLVSTHPDIDHAGGLSKVIDGLEPLEVWMHLPWEHSPDILNLFHDGRITDQSLSERVKGAYNHIHEAYEKCLDLGIPVTEPFSDSPESNQYENLNIYILGPSKGYYQSLIPNFRGTPSAKRAESLALSSSIINKLLGISEAVKNLTDGWLSEALNDPKATDTGAENNSSVIILIILDDQYFLFTGDSGSESLQLDIDHGNSRKADWKKMRFLKVPHHGSKHNIGPTILNQILGNIGNDSDVSCYIPATKGDKGHPHSQVLKALIRRGGKVFTSENALKRHQNNAPDRDGYETAQALEFNAVIDDD